MSNPDTDTLPRTLMLVLVLPLLVLFALPATGQSDVFISKNADFSTEDSSFDPFDTLYLKVVAPDIDHTDLVKNEFRLKPDEGGNEIETHLENNLNGTYTTHVDLSTTDQREDDWEVRVRIEDETGREFRKRIDITIGEDDGQDNFKDDELDFTGRLDSIAVNGVSVDGIFFIVDGSTVLLNDDEQPITLNDLFEGQIVGVRGKRHADGTLRATEIEVEDNFPDEDGVDEVEFTGVIDSLSSDLVRVAGIEFDVDDQTAIIDDNDQPLQLIDLFIGQIVEIKGNRGADGRLLATRIELEDGIRGVVEVEITGKIDALTDQSITVNGTLFDVDEHTVVFGDDDNRIEFSILTEGQFVEVKGFRQPDGRILAVRIEIEDRDEDEVELTGEIEGIEGNQIIVAGLTFVVGDHTIVLNDDEQRIALIDLSVGLIVEIRAEVQLDGTLLATDIEIEDRLEDEVEVRGVVESISDTSVVVLGRLFHVLSNTEVLDHNGLPVPFESVAAGSIVEIHASLLPGDVLIALRIEMENDDPSRVRVRGPVYSVDSDTLSVAGIHLLIDGQTMVTDQNGNNAAASDLEEGQTVDVDALTQANALPLATQIRIKKVARMRGALTGIEANQVVLAGAFISVDENTLVLDSKNGPVSLDMLSKGQYVDIYAIQESTGFVASKVEILESRVVVTGIEDANDLPRQFRLNQNYPNPFNPSTTISFEIQTVEVVGVSLTIYNVLGQSVRTLLSQDLGAGHYEVEWDGRNDNGQELASGLYLYQLRVDQTVFAKTMVLMK